MSRFKNPFDKLFGRSAKKPKTPLPNLECPKTEKKLDPISTNKITSKLSEKLKHASFNQKQNGVEKTSEFEFDNEKKPQDPKKL